MDRMYVVEARRMGLPAAADNKNSLKKCMKNLDNVVLSSQHSDKMMIRMHSGNSQLD
jgi:hypothetical protein